MNSLFASLRSTAAWPIRRLPFYRLASADFLRRELRTSVNQIRRGQVVDFRSKPCLVLKRDHGKTGRGNAVIKIELKDLVSGQRQTERFNPGDTLEVLHLHTEEYQFLYLNKGRIHLLNTETYEELDMDANMIEGSEKQLDLLHDGMVVSVQILEPDQALTYRLPKYHTYTVDRDEPGAAQAAKGVSYKTAYIADGKVRIVVPEFVQVGDRVVVDLEECSYVSRESKA